LALLQTAKLSSAALVILVDEGKIKWDDKVIKYLQILKYMIT
jgi:CubicO group peptidase (beta-lactamase class C family)